MDEDRILLIEQQIFALQNEMAELRVAVERQRPLAGNCIAADETAAGTLIHISPGFMAGVDEYFGAFAMIYVGKNTVTGRDRFAVVDLSDGADSTRAGQVIVSNEATTVTVPRFEDDMEDGDISLITTATGGVANSYISFYKFADSTGGPAEPLLYADVVVIGHIREGRMIQIWRSGARTIDNRWW
ncbi:MAG: hypothetical protein PHI85_10525 [Victivallaceae bacterium]|nr:hypothetical protein [Victivallaceae bacterium]